MFDLITKCVLVILWIFVVSAYNEGKWCPHPGANYHMKVNMSNKECEGYFPPGTIATYYCDADYNMISNRSIKNCVNGIWNATEPIFCGIYSATSNNLIFTNIADGSLRVVRNTDSLINENTTKVFVYENEDCKDSKNGNLTSIYIHLKNESLFSKVALELTFELVNKTEFNVSASILQEKLNATYYACAFPNETDCTLFKSIKKMFKQSVECGSPNQNEGTLMTNDKTKADYFCPKNSYLVGNKSISCKFGIWTDKAPKCQDDCKVLQRAKINNIIKTTAKTVVIIIIIQWMLTGIAFLYFKYYKYQAKYLIKIKNDN